jgi:hypothetical protein
MITALTALRASLPAVVNPSRQRLVTSALNNRSVARRLVSQCSACGPREQETHTVCSWLQLAAKRALLFSSTYGLFFQAFTPDFLCFHQVPASFLQNRGVGGT